MANVISNTATGTKLVDDLLASSRWAGNQITFGFTSTASQYGSGYGSGETNSGYTPLSTQQMAAVKDALGAWGELINLKITQVDGASADIRIAASSLPATAWAYTPNSSSEGGDVWLGTSKGYYTNPVDGNYAKLTIIHELGHALGLGHPHQPVLGVGAGNFVDDDGADDSVSPAENGADISSSAEHFGASTASTLASGDSAKFGADTAADAIDAMAYSVMSYSSYAGDGRGGYTNGTWDYAQSPMVRDIAAVQNLYGANYNTRSGDTVYSWSATTGEKFIDGIGQGAPGGNKVFETIWDGGGRDTIDLSNYSSDLSIDLNPGGWINFNNSQVANLGAGQKAPGNVAMSFLYQGDNRSLIENAVGGTGNDTIKGNAGHDVLIGGAGDDHIQAGSGSSILAGGTIGNELSLLGLVRDDYVKIVPKISGNDGNDTLVGGAGNDIFVAGNGNDTIDGGGGLNTLAIDASLETIKIVNLGGSVVITYNDSRVIASNLDYIATKDGIYAIAGTDSGYDASKIAELRDELSLVYKAGLDRKIDPTGSAYWLKVLNDGASINRLSAGIIDAPEFAAKFGDPRAMNDAQFVQVLYKNVLDRAGEDAGVQYWTHALATGTARANVLTAFSLSDENKTHVQSEGLGLINDGTKVDLVAVSQTQWHDIWA